MGAEETDPKELYLIEQDYDPNFVQGDGAQQNDQFPNQDVL